MRGALTMSRRGWYPIRHQGGWRSCLEHDQGCGQLHGRDEVDPSVRPDCGQLGSEGQSHAPRWNEDQPEATELGSRYRTSRVSAEKGRWGRRWGPGWMLGLSPIWWTRGALMSQRAVCTAHSQELCWEPGVLDAAPWAWGQSYLLGLGFLVRTWASPGSTRGAPRGWGTVGAGAHAARVISSFHGECRLSFPGVQACPLPLELTESLTSAGLKVPIC